MAGRVNTLVASLGVLSPGSFTVREIATWFTWVFAPSDRASACRPCAYACVFHHYPGRHPVGQVRVRRIRTDDAIPISNLADRLQTVLLKGGL